MHMYIYVHTLQYIKITEKKRKGKLKKRNSVDQLKFPASKIKKNQEKSRKTKQKNKAREEKENGMVRKK